VTQSSSRPTPSPRRARIIAGGFVGLATAILLLLSACGETSTSATTTPGGQTSTEPTSTVTCPSSSTQTSWQLVKGGNLTIASDTTYAPAEFSDPNNPSSYIGYDMDLARELARRLCLNPDIIKADFGAIITDVSGPPLGQQRYDLSISSFTINDARKQKVDMIPYLTAGESILVKSGNPAGITSYQTMCGKIVAAQDNTVEFDELQDLNGTGDGQSGAPVGACKGNLVKIVHFADQNNVVLQVVNGSADASYQDQPVTGYFVSKNPSKLQEGGITVSPSPEGIVVRKDNPALEQAITDALTAMRKDGTYLRILKAWGAQGLAYPAQ
jgi:polar amino acid transport system substrate-binding protein